jgi:hypothetical protein
VSIRRALAVAALFSLGAAPGADLSARLPEGVPAASILSGWERIDGRFEQGSDDVLFHLYVDPERPLIYRITHYRVRALEAADTGGRTSEPEILIWNDRPGIRVPLRCFRRMWQPAQAGDEPAWTWVALPPETADYRRQMFRAIQIYNWQQQHEPSTAPSVGR